MTNRNQTLPYKNFYIFANLFFVVLLFFQVPEAFGQAQMLQQDATYQEQDASSANYQIKGAIGDPTVGTSSSTNYIMKHGRSWPELYIQPIIKWAVPGARVGGAGTNDDTTFYLTIRTAVDTDNTVLWTQSALLTTNNDGTYTTPIPIQGIAPGTYDVGIKTEQHLTKKIDNITLVRGNNILDFSQTSVSDPNYGTTQGSVKLLSGDINGTGATPATLGDDAVNSVDISITLNDLNKTDATGNTYRANLNQDAQVNSVDISMLLSNLNLTGDT
jgi:hypothetical protein